MMAHNLHTKTRQWGLRRTLLAAILAVLLSAASISQPLADDTHPTSYEVLGRRLEERLATMDWGGGELGISVGDAQLPITALERNSQESFNAGRLTQIVIAAAALERLGADFRYSTQILLPKGHAGDTLRGPLVIQGDGDPSIGASWFDDREGLARWNRQYPWREIDEWARQLRKMGLTRVEGPLIADASAFDNQWRGHGWPKGDRGSYRQPSVAALNFNSNEIAILIRGGKKPGLMAETGTMPNLPGYVFL